MSGLPAPVGKRMASEMVAHACAMMVQDAGRSVGQTTAIASAATAWAVQQMVAKQTPQPYAGIIAAAASAVASATAEFTAGETAAAEVMQKFE